MKPEPKFYTCQLGDKQITLETGRLARQAGGSVTIRQGDTIVFAAATMGASAKASISSPSRGLRRRMYAGGRSPAPSSAAKAASTDATLVCLTDRPLRRSSQGMRNEVQVVLMSLSSDGENPLDMLAVNAGSAA